MKPHKDERIHEREEANSTGRYSTFTVCRCNIGKDHEHFYSQYDFHKADIANRMECMQDQKPIPTNNKAVPPYFYELPRFIEPVYTN